MTAKLGTDVSYLFGAMCGTLVVPLCSTLGSTNSLHVPPPSLQVRMTTELEVNLNRLVGGQRDAPGESGM